MGHLLSMPYSTVPVTPSELSDPVHVPTDAEISTANLFINQRIRDVYNDQTALIRVTDIVYTTRRVCLPLYTAAGWTVVESSSIVGSLTEVYWTLTVT